MEIDDIIEQAVKFDKSIYEVKQDLKRNGYKLSSRDIRALIYERKQYYNILKSSKNMPINTKIKYMLKNGLSQKEIAKIISRENKITQKDAYEYLVNFKNNKVSKIDLNAIREKEKQTSIISHKKTVEKRPKKPKKEIVEKNENTIDFLGRKVKHIYYNYYIVIELGANVYLYPDDSHKEGHETSITSIGLKSKNDKIGMQRYQKMRKYLKDIHAEIIDLYLLDYTSNPNGSRRAFK